MLRPRTLIVAVICVAVGAAAGIAGTSAAPKKRSSHAARHAGVREFRHHGRFGGGPPVHVAAVVLNRAGDKFITVTEDNGKLKSISGDDLTITEGTDKVAYKDVMVTVPSDAKVSRNWQDAQLSDLKEGDFVHVASSADGTFVFAVDPNATPPHPPGGPWGGPHRGPGGPPPGGPDGDGARGF